MTMPDDRREQRGLGNQFGDVGGDLLRRYGLSVVVGWALALIGGLLAVIGYYSVSATTELSDQVSRLAGTSFGGLALVGIGGVLVLTSHYRQTVDALLDLRDDLAGNDEWEGADDDHAQ